MRIRLGMGLGTGAMLALLVMAAPCLAAPTNDASSQRIHLALNRVDIEDNTDATIEPSERLTANDPAGLGCNADGDASTGGTQMDRTLWWAFTGNGGPVTVSTIGSGFDTVLAVYEVPTDAMLACNDDVEPLHEGVARVTSEVVVNTVQGREYKVQAGSCTGFCAPLENFGDITLRISKTPTNDDRASAVPIQPGVLAKSSNEGATSEPGEITSCGGSLYAKTVWFRFRAPAVGTATFSASGFDTVMSVYREGSTAPLGCNDDAVSGQHGASQLPSIDPPGQAVEVQPGEYLIQVGGFYDSEANLQPIAAQEGPLSVLAEFTEDIDLDNDGVDRSLDCDESNARVYPGAPEIPNDGVDENCDGLEATDQDHDGYLAPPLGPDCNDGNAEINPGAREVRGNQIDENCDGKKGPYRYLHPNIQMGSFAYDGQDPHVQVREVFLTSVLKDSEVELKCHGGCPFQSKGPVRIRRAGGKVVIAHGFRLKIGAEVEVRVTKLGWIGRAKIYRFPPGKPRKELERCIAPNGALRACA
jgi:hypothetical protein